MWKSLRESACEGHFGAAETSQENITPVFPKTSHPSPPKHHNQNRPRTRHELEQHKQHKENNTHCTSITRKTTHNSTNNTGSNNTGKTTSKDFCIAPRHKWNQDQFKVTKLKIYNIQNIQCHSIQTHFPQTPISKRKISNQNIQKFVLTTD